VAIPNSGSLLSKSLKNDEWEEFLYGKLTDATGNEQTLGTQMPLWGLRYATITPADAWSSTLQLFWP
jgi:hypothetical protein